jgi:hypothetical protein
MAGNLLDPTDLAVRQLRDQQRGLRVLSYFDGMSGGQEILRQLGVPVDAYAAAEIDENAKAITQNRFPGTLQLGAVHEGGVGGRSPRQIAEAMGGLPDMMCGGSPCQDLSRAGKQAGLVEGKRSSLFFPFADQMDEFDVLRDQAGLPPMARFVENVNMDPTYRDMISERLGMEPRSLNAAEWGPVFRDRLYWTNIPGFEDLQPPGGTSAEEWVRTHPEDFSPHTAGAKDFMMRPDRSGRTPYERWASRPGQGADRFRAFVAQHGKVLPFNVHDLSPITGLDADLRKVNLEGALEMQGFPRDYFEGLRVGRGGVPQKALWHAIGNGWNLRTVKDIFRGVPGMALEGLKYASRSV